ncbi:MAG: PAS domain S-box protein, partial [Gammaproteobacteria bacterium]|nr:PAS domain S-box protein [Gammaproteobacteria bacterium]
MENIVDGIITINESGIVQDFNRAAEKIFGYKADEVVGHNINKLMPNPYAEEHDGYLSNYVETGNAKIIGIGREVEGMRKDGSTFPLELAVSEMLIDGERLFSGIVRDITERKNIERTLRATETRQRAVLEHTVDGIITINESGIVQDFNLAAEKIFGYQADEVIGNNINVLMPNPYAREHDSYLKNYFQTGKARIIGIGRDVEGMRKDGSTFPLELAVSEMVIDGERLFSGIVRDITER